MNKKQLTKIMGIALFMTLISNTLLTTAVSARETWIPRSVAQIKSDLISDESGLNAYTIQWGDTLYAISLATDMSIEHLAKVNNIENIRLIHTGNTIYFNEDKTVITVASQEEKGVLVQSFNVVDGHEVPTPKQTIEKIEQEKQPQHVQVLQEETREEIKDVTSQEETQQSVEEITAVVSLPAISSTSPHLYALSEFMYSGIIYWSQYKFTYYSQSVLPGGGLVIPGRHVNENGYVVDGDGYIVLANSAPLGTVIDTPFGAKGKVYDRGTSGNHFDVYIR
ncbi:MULTISPECIES: LysM domain-containing protein [unclassified Granulicatella]|uniref:LysM peptidoglycan-binding domain-containing protein n=1 Tax=unclassified Granulicatella TaxID=2630493 RepID=UPI001431E8BC|nr:MULTISPECIES: LysM domain-containing protein [unclassified Granulicatella]MBF0779504.1 LysM peptidoglycan-binding domain-containing protein [Granulicatella sp. 19428wC4_WM01]